MKKLLVTSLCIVSLAGCRADGTLDTTQVGSLVGAIGGAYLAKDIGGGNGNVLATALGSLFGSQIGANLGSRLSTQDTTYMQNAAHTSLETTTQGVQTPWHNPQTGVQGTIVPTRTYQQNNLYCRDFRQTIQIDNRSHDATGTACRQPDGTWKIVQQ